MRINVVFAVIGACLLLNSPRLSAHHSFAAEFDAHRPVKFRGIVTKMEWINPHAWIHVAVAKPDGTTTEWMIECGAPNAAPHNFADYRVRFCVRTLPERS